MVLKRTFENKLSSYYLSRLIKIGRERCWFECFNMKLTYLTVFLLSIIIISLCTIPAVTSPIFNVDKVNFCNVDSDCVTVNLPYCCTNWGASINKQFVESWNSNLTIFCKQSDIVCPALYTPKPPSLCINNKCQVAVKSLSITNTSCIAGRTTLVKFTLNNTGNVPIYSSEMNPKIGVYFGFAYNNSKILLSNLSDLSPREVKEYSGSSQFETERDTNYSIVFEIDANLTEFIVGSPYLTLTCS